MREHRVSLLEIILIAATRGMIGFGAGLLIAERLGHARRRAVGRALLSTGALSTIPLAIRLFRRRAEDQRRVEEELRRAESDVVMAD